MSEHLAASESSGRFIIRLQHRGKGRLQFILYRITVMPSFGQILKKVVPEAVDCYIAHWLFLLLICLLDACLQRLIRVDYVIYSVRL